MKVRVVFGFAGEEFEFGWFRPLLDFPQLLRFKGDTWEFTMHSDDHRGKVDKVLHFAKCYNVHKHIVANAPDFEQHFGALLKKKGNCECGAHFTSFPQIHMQFCPEYGKKTNTPPPDDEL